MKTKKVLVTYLNSHHFDKQVANRIMFHKILDEMKQTEGEILKEFITIRGGVIEFVNGSKLYLEPFGENLRGLRLTQVYISSHIRQLPNGHKFVDEILLPCLYNKKTDEKQLFFYSLENEELKIT